MTRLLLAIFLIAALCLGAALSYYNLAPVRLHYLAGQVELPLIAVMLGAFLAGMLLGLLVGLVRQITQRAELAAVRRQLRNAQAELKNLRSLPLRETAKPSTSQPEG